ncbi:MAG: Bax inhibitor-1/YccA family protein [Alphaproteobacteria bacterium]|nr:Bax inhibitor-1/YccA family protein [Alphaproteobacteria bacterium]
METKSYASAVERATVDEGLRSYMIKVYNYMTGGLCLTALTVYLLINTGLIRMFFSVNNGYATLSILGWAMLIAPLIMVFMFNSAVSNGSAAKVQTIFWLFSAVMGASISPIMLVYTGASLFRVFLITAATFGAMSLYGYTTKKDLTSMGSFMIMGLWGVIIASLVNLFMQSETMYWVISYVAVAIFVGLTAWDTQRIKYMYASHDNEDTITRKAVAGALSLYMDFINLFLYLLRIMGDRK